MFIAGEKALRGALVVGREKEGELATTSLEYEFHLQFPVAPRRLSCQISDNQRKAERSANVARIKTNIEKHVPRVMTSFDIITNVISANQNSRDVVASSSSFSRPAVRAPGELARRLLCLLPSI